MAELKVRNMFSFLEELPQWYHKNRDNFFLSVFDGLDEPSKMFVLYKAFNGEINKRLNDKLVDHGHYDLLLSILLSKKEEADVKREKAQEHLDKKSENKEELFRKIEDLGTYTNLLTQALDLDLEYFRLKSRIDILEK